jgi:hypothetical protein
MFNEIRQLKTQANQSVIAGQMAIKGLDVTAEEFTEEQELAIRKAFMGLKESRDQMTAYGSNLLKRIIRWIFCGKTIHQVNRAISEILPFRTSSKLLKGVKNEFEAEIKKSKEAYQGERRVEFERKIDQCFSGVFKSLEALMTKIDDLADLNVIDKLSDEDLEEQSKKLSEELKVQFEDELPRIFKELIAAFGQEDYVEMPKF